VAFLDVPIKFTQNTVATDIPQSRTHIRGGHVRTDMY
jgi:hypothetical protein